jgi:hypothetical protein
MNFMAKPEIEGIMGVCGPAPGPRHGRATLSGAVLLLCLWTLHAGCSRSVPDSGSTAGSTAATRPPVNRPASGDLPSAGTRRMAARLDDLNRNMDPRKNRFKNRERVRLLSAIRERQTDPVRRATMTIRLGHELLRLGANEQAIALLQPLLTATPVQDPAWRRPIEVRALIAVCLYRLGIQDNCMAHPNCDRCLLPVSATGRHVEKRGAEGAMKELLTILDEMPNDIGSIWVLNVAAMQIGAWPDGVPERFRIPPSVFASDNDIGRFPNVAIRAGLGNFNHAGGGIMEDFDGDGMLDILVTSMGLTDQMHLFHNEGDGTFIDVTGRAGLTGETGGLNATDADYDNDGDVDVLVLRGGWAREGGVFPNSLLRNRGDGTFEDVTEEAGILSFHPTQLGAWGDYDNDGFLDLFIGNESSDEQSHPSELWHNNRDGTFSSEAALLGNPDLGYVKGAAWGDYDNDGDQDLYVSRLYGDNRLFRNDGQSLLRFLGAGHWKFTEVSSQAGVTRPENSFPTWFWDYDNDGWLDLMVAGYRMIPSESNVADVAQLYLGLPNLLDISRLYHNNRDGTFTDVAEAMHIRQVPLPMGCNYGDLDNDGWPDAYFGTGEPSLRTIIPNRMFRNDEGKAFQDVTTSSGTGHLQKGHGVAFGDIDNDGDQDVFEQMGGFFVGDVAQNVLYENPGHGHHWVTLRLEGRRTNRSGFGVRIKVRVTTPRGPRDIHALGGTGGSFGGNTLQQEIGLGDATTIETIEVTWPVSEETQIFRAPAMDRTYKVVEGEPQLTPIAVKRYKL